jgi:hypothetical protein
LPGAGLLDQMKLLTMKYVPLLASDLKYALRLANVIHLIATRDSIRAVNQMAGIIDLKNSYSQ